MITNKYKFEETGVTLLVLCEYWGVKVLTETITFLSTTNYVKQ